MKPFLLLCAIAVPAVAAAQTDSAAPAVPASGPVVERTAHGAFSADQVERGKKVFESWCASCHAPDFHTGEQFRFSWYGRTLLDYFRLVKRTMPEDNPGGLTDDDYTRVITYILTLNGFQPGADSLRSDTLDLKRTRIGAPPQSP